MQLLSVLNCQDDGKATVILPGELSVGSYKAALAVCKGLSASIAVLNCAGKRFHEFMPMTRKDFDQLRNERPPRMLDLEWEDSESFEIPWADIEAALAWARAQVSSGLLVLINCAQGKSRSGMMATAYLMAKLKLPAAHALAMIQAKRPLVDPNPAFMRQLQSFEARLWEQPTPIARDEARLREAFVRYDSDCSGGLSVTELRVALMQNGEPANAAKPMLEEFAAGAELTIYEFVRAWVESGRGPIAL